MTDPLQHEAFAANLNTIFKVQVAEAQEIETKLVKVSDLNLTEIQERFYIIFKGPNDPFLGQGMRRFTHDQMGEFDLFVVPISQDESGTNYEAVFNRLARKD
jgi:hypothetical protein